MILQILTKTYYSILVFKICLGNTKQIEYLQKKKNSLWLERSHRQTILVFQVGKQTPIPWLNQFLLSLQSEAVARA